MVMRDGQPAVAHNGMTVARDEAGRGLHVAMEEAFRMRGLLAIERQAVKATVKMAFTSS